MKQVLIVAALLAVGLSAWGQTPASNNMPGMDLKKMCGHDETSMWCLGLIYGFFAFDPSSRFIPEDVTPGQFELVLIKYMDEHPEKLNWSAEMIVRFAAVDAWAKKESKHPL
jgi:hypothetical protein